MTSAGPGRGSAGAPTAIALSPILSARYRSRDLERIRAAAPGARLVTVSVEFNISFTYDSGTHKVTGRATLTVNVEVACFSKSVELTVERSFGRDGGDPAFGDLMATPADWAQYAEAFA